MKIREVLGKIIRDSRNDETIQIKIKTESGLFTSSAPSGKSKGKYEKPYFMRKPQHDIIMLKKYTDKLCEFNLQKFHDLERVEYLFGNRIGSNTLCTLETAILKALASSRGEQLWQFLNPKAKKFPFPVGNCIEGGLHSSLKKKPDFQEFLIIPKTDKFSDNVFLMKEARRILGDELKLRKVKDRLGDEDAWTTPLDNESCLEIMKKVKEELEEQVGERIGIGIDLASSTFYTGFLYNYKNPVKKLKQKEQIEYVLDLIDKYNIDYIEDPLEQDDFAGFNKLRYNSVRIRPTSIIVGDDLTVSNLVRFKRALKERSINAVILKPNQIGSLLEIAEIVKLAKRFGIKIIMSHRSGETLDNSLADLAFGLQTDYIKTGIVGKEREVKLKRIIEIEKSLS